MATFLKTKDFLVLLRAKMHVSYNWLILNQFRLNLKSANIPEPRLFRNFKEESPTTVTLKEVQPVDLPKEKSAAAGQYL